ncbi:hypothetical protein MKW98_029178 [Papaver atlanticum]|uniref:CASP-like protein n=1 Tax=Papaver atlanticum TaxID=357466 RepID=A0AAD4T2T0_9MAGN|nr:hypothetical protein MKW98_029178 [Papaver atlanticum]
MDRRIIISFILRIFQMIFSCSALAAMTTAQDVDDYVAFSFLMIIMSLLTPWSLMFAIAQGYSDLAGYLLLQPGIIKISIIIGDAILSFLALAAACSAAAVINYFPDLKGSSRYQLAATLAFFTWIATTASSLLNFWFFHSM